MTLCVISFLVRYVCKSGVSIISFDPGRRLVSCVPMREQRTAKLTGHFEFDNHFTVFLLTHFHFRGHQVSEVFVFIFISFFDEFSGTSCGVTSGAILFAYVPQKERQAYMG